MKKLVLLVALASAFATSHAEEFIVNTLLDTTDEACDLTSCSLRAAVIAANDLDGPDIITLGPGTHVLELDGSDSSEEVGDLDIRDDVTIRGVASTVIDAQENSRILDISSDAEVTLMNLTIQNGRRPASSNGTYNGAAVSIRGGALTVDNVVFVDNVGPSLGGGIYSTDGALVEIRNSEFSGNAGSFGGAVHARSGATISNTTFSMNRADVGAGNGAALYLTGTTGIYELRDLSISSNYSTGNGGALLFGGQHLTLRRVIGESNQSDGANGGFMFITGTAHLKTIEILDSEFIGNEGERGGAIAFGDDQDFLRIYRSTFHQNIATDDGGAFLLTGGSTLLFNVTVSNNDAVNDGGAMFNFGAQVRAVHTTFVGNDAVDGPDVRVALTSGSTVRFSNSVLTGGCVVSAPTVLVSEGGNVEANSDSCGLDALSDRVNQAPQDVLFDALADNGGATRTRLPDPSNVVLNAGVPATCDAIGGDQRQAARDSTCDSGAVELGATPDDVIFVDGFDFIF